MVLLMRITLITDTHSQGIFVVVQGIQRRLVVTIIHENSMDIRIRKVTELVVGK